MKHVLSTKNYKQFNILAYNRQLNRSLVNHLTESIEKHGYFSGKPIIVDKNFNIIDGQHRFEACRHLKLPILYTVTQVDPQEAMIALNSNQVSWKMIDYIRSWADSGKKCYVDLINFDTENSFGITNSVLIYFDASADKNSYAKIKKGDSFKMNPHAHDIVKFIKACSSVPYYKSSYFVKAAVRLFKLATPEQIDKIAKNIISLPQQANPNAYLVSFENMINKNVHTKNRVSFKINS